jgi:hypothetical protein
MSKRGSFLASAEGLRPRGIKFMPYLLVFARGPDPAAANKIPVDNAGDGVILYVSIMSCHSDRAWTLSIGDPAPAGSPRGGVKPPPQHHYPPRPDHEANQKAKGKGQKCSNPPIFEFPFSMPSYLLEMKVQPIISSRIKEGKFRRWAF